MDGDQGPAMDVSIRQDWEDVSRLLAAAMEQPLDRRMAFVRAAAVDGPVQAEVESLLAISETASAFFDDLAPDLGLPFVQLPSEALEADIRWSPGERVGRFTIHEELGRGGMGVVYAAYDDHLDRRVALKFVDAEISNAEASESDENRSRFLREARAASALNHPHICTIHDAGTADDERAYIVMACYDGETLHACLRRGALPLNVACPIAGEIASALAAAHKAGIVHRDLKPANVMLTPSHGVKLLDFGIAKLREATGFTSSDLAPGTLSYVSPEQVRGEEITSRADVWAFGVVLYEMLAGRRPFEGASPAAVLYEILESTPQPLDVHAPGVPEPLVELVNQCLRKQPSERPSADVIRGVLQAMDIPTRARLSPVPPESPRTQLDRSRKRKKTKLKTHRVAGVIGICLAGVVAVSLLAWGWRAPEVSGDARARSTVVAVLPFGVPANTELGYLREGMVDLLSAQLDGVAGIRSVDPNWLLGVVGDEPVRDPVRAGALARRLGASGYILGQVIPVGDGFHLNATYYEGPTYEKATVPAARAQTLVPRSDALLDGLNRLARTLVAELLDAPDQHLASLAAQTTASVPALRAYLDGEQYARTGRFGEAIEAYTAAIAADSTFALAWYRLARAAGWKGDRALNLQAIERAVYYSSMLPGRTQSMISAYDAFRNGNPGEAERRYRDILEDAPDDAETWYLFGETLFHNNPHQGRSTAEAREPFAQAAMYDPNNREMLVHLIDLAAREERWTALDTLTARYLRPGPGRVALRAPYQLLRSLTLEASVVREESWGALVESGPDAIYAALVRVGPLLMDLDVSLRLARLLTDPVYDARWRVSGFIHIGLIEAARGRWTSAEQAFLSADAVTPGAADVHRALSVVASGASDIAVQAVYDDLEGRTASDNVTRLFLLGWMKAHLGDRAGFGLHRDRVEEASRANGPDGVEAGRLLVAMDAAWMFQNESPSAALNRVEAINADLPFHVREPDPLLSLPQYRSLRAGALASTGRTDESLRWYEATHDGYYHWGTPALAMTTWRQADLLVRQGRAAEAEAAYRRVLTLWAEADVSLAPAVETVRQRLDALRHPQHARSSPTQQ